MKRFLQRYLWLLVFVALMGGLGAAAAAGALAPLFSPGELSRAHAELQNSCRACHGGGFRRGIAEERCLFCHETVDRQIRGEEAGIHAGVTGGCVQCHTEHKGADAVLTRIDPTRFDHEVTRFSTARHPNARDCTSCHAPEALQDPKAFQAATEPACDACHRTVAPDPTYAWHVEAFGTDCLACHRGDGRFNPDFNHLFVSDFPLEGSHQILECTECHIPESAFAVAGRDCLSCHGPKAPHLLTEVTARCETCHTPAGWTPVTYVHQTFVLEGKHREVACVQCHPNDAYRTTPTTCDNCHLKDSPHGDRFLALKRTCDTCHTPAGWSPSTFAHAGVQECRACHQPDAPANHFPGECGFCHATQAWTPAWFNHQAAGAVDCQACHLKDRPPNHFQGQCSTCHSTQAWKPATFNHQAAGAVDCQACHLKDRPPNHFQGQCSTCHSTQAWKPATFVHAFPLNHGGAGGRCTTCHPNNNPPAYTCYTCHDPTKTAQKHQREGIANIDGRCVQCHPTGREGD